MGEGVSRGDCISCWKTLRDKFVREVKQRKTGDSGPAYASTWPLFSMMLFLADSVKHRPLSNVAALKSNHAYHMLVNCRSDTNFSALAATASEVVPELNPDKETNLEMEGSLESLDNVHTDEDSR